jgi:hypothetical protein
LTENGFGDGRVLGPDVAREHRGFQLGKPRRHRASRIEMPSAALAIGNRIME